MNGRGRLKFSVVTWLQRGSPHVLTEVIGSLQSIAVCIVLPLVSGHVLIERRPAGPLDAIIQFSIKYKGNNKIFKWTNIFLFEKKLSTSLMARLLFLKLISMNLNDAN